jgi:heat-inducible transcriptional repressor
MNVTGYGGAMMRLDARKSLILQAIVEDHIETAEPIGSEWLAAHHNFGCRSATLRNEMAEMSEWGYLLQPHPSAGRIPTDLGYRYYVDWLMALPPIPELEDQPAIFTEPITARDVEEIVLQTCRLLASITQYPSVATAPPVRSPILRRIYMNRVSPQQCVVVLLLSTGHIEYRIIEVEATSLALQRVANYLNEVLAGHYLDTLEQDGLGEIPAELIEDQPLLSAVYACVQGAAKELVEDRLFLEGTKLILRQREFQDVCRLEQLLGVLERQSVLVKVLRHAVRDKGVAVVIGQESRVAEMQDCSVVTSPYSIRERAVGFIGVLGPKRMHYDRAVSAVSSMAKNLSSLLASANLT